MSDSNYTAYMKYVTSMQNLTFGEDGGLQASCERMYPSNPHYGFMRPHMRPHMHGVIKTPYYVFNDNNSKFESWVRVKTLERAADYLGN